MNERGNSYYGKCCKKIDVLGAGEKLEKLSEDILAVMQTAEVLEHSLYFASERQDKDMTKPCSTVAETMIKMLQNIHEEMSDLAFDVERLSKNSKKEGIA